MILLRCHVAGFGRLSGLPLTFAEGLNVIFAANEAGKSTLQRFLVAGFYGQLRTDVKTQRRLDSWVEPYKPWHAPAYGGILWCRLANGRELEVNRTFGKEEGRIEIRTSTGEEITRQYEVQRNGDLLFAAAHLGLAKELFESVAVFRESETALLRGHESLRDRIANLARSGDERLSVRQSLARLEEALESIGSERAPTRPYKQALERRQALTQEHEALETQRRQYRESIQERQELTGELERLEQAARAAGRAVLDARWREARLRVLQLDDMDSEVRSLEAESGSLGAVPDFPFQEEERLNRLETDKAHFDQRLEELARLKQALESRCAHGTSELSKLAAYGTLAGVETEKVTEWFVHCLSLSRQRDELQRTLNRLADESKALEDAMAALSPELRDPDRDWELMARQAAEEEREASRLMWEVRERIAEGKAAQGDALRKSRRSVLLVALCLAATAAAAGLSLGGFAPAIPGWTLAAILAVASSILSVRAARSRSAARQASVSLERLDSELQSVRDRARTSQAALDQAVASSGFKTAEEFLAASRRTAQDRERLLDLVARISDVGDQRARVQAEADELYARLKECLEKVGLSAAPGNLRVAVDALRAGMRRHAELQAGQRRLDEELAALRDEEAAVAAQSGEAGAAIGEILAAGAVDSADEFRLACGKARRFAELRSKITARAGEFDRLRGPFSLEEWRARLQELGALRGSADENGAAGNGSPRQPAGLPYVPAVEETEQEERSIAGLLAGRREEAARLAERIRQAFRNLRTPAEIEEDLAEAERSVAQLALNRRALETALAEINGLARQQQEVWAPQLNRAVEERFLRICPDRYEEVKIDPDFRIHVRERETAELRPAESLSRGTQDQIYFSVRFGVLELLGDPQEPSPCLLDEPFVAYDPDRMRAAFRVLDEEGKRRQLLIFTCREDVRDLALRHGAHLVTL